MRAKALSTRGPLLAALMCLAATGAARALDFPTRTIRLVVPFAAAGVTDIVARIVFDKVAQALGQQVIIDNRPGAGGTIAVDAVAHSPPDGYTLVMADPSGSLPANLTLYPKLNFHPLRDLAPVASLGTTGAVLLVANELPAKTIHEFVALAKAKPGELTFSSSGSGGAPHLAGEMFKNLTGTELLHVPYRGSGPAVIDLIAGRITMMFDATPSLLPNITAGKLRPIAAASPQRHRLLPDVPSFAELGYPGMDIALWYGVVVPGGTPAPIVQRLNAELAKIVDMPDVRRNLSEQGADLQGGSAEDFGAFMRNESARWSVVVKQAGIKPE